MQTAGSLKPGAIFVLLTASLSLAGDSPKVPAALRQSRRPSDTLGGPATVMTLHIVYYCLSGLATRGDDDGPR